LAGKKENTMNLTEKMLIALLVGAATLVAAPGAAATTGEALTPGEVAYLSDVAADGMGPAASAQGLVDEGWTICHAVIAGMPVATAAGKVYAGSRSAVGAEGVSQAQALRVVTHAMDDLCPATTPNANEAT
jgi:hypothetical protein